jgi:hypothetical protein
LVAGAIACAHRSNSSLARTAPDLAPATATDQAVYEAVLADLAREYAQGGKLRVNMITMAPCDPASTIVQFDCVGERSVTALERPWVRTGRRAFDGLIADSTRSELVEAHRTVSTVPHRMMPGSTTAFLFMNSEQIAAEASSGSAGVHPGSAVLTRAAYSSDDFAFIYAVYGRMRFATGMIFLLRRSGDTWTIVSRVGIWVT